MKMVAKLTAKREDEILREYAGRLAELESELRSYPSDPEARAFLSFVRKPRAAKLNEEPVVQFTFGGKTYAIGHNDMTYADTNHARGIRYISFYADGKRVLFIEGDFEDQQFGSNFRFQSAKVFTPGEWEKGFVKLTDQMRACKEERREIFRKNRDAAKNRAHS